MNPKKTTDVELLEPRRLLSAYTLTTLGSFSDSNGVSSLSRLVMDTHGDIFGASGGSGPNFDGTLFEIRAGSQSITTLYSFTGGSDGANPTGALAIDANGDLFGATVSGGDQNYDPNSGTNGHGTLFELAAGATTVTTLYTFSPTTQVDYGGVVRDSNGNLYGLTTAGAGMGAGVFELPAGTHSIVSLYHAFGTVQTNAGEVSDGVGVGDSLMGLQRDAAGDLFGTMEETFVSGGVTGTGGVNFTVLFELPAAGGGLTALTPYNTFFENSYASGPNSLAVDPSGDLFGTAGIGNDSNNDGIVFELSAGGTITTLASFNGANGSVANGGSVALDAQGDLFISTANGGADSEGAVLEIPSGTATMNTVYTLGSQSNDPGSPADLQIDPSGNIYGLASGGDYGSGVTFELSTSGGGGGGGGGFSTGLTPAIMADTVPVSVVGGVNFTAGSLKLNLANPSSSAEDGFTVNVYASSDTTLDTTSDTLVTALTKSTIIKAGTSINLALPIKNLPASLPDGHYYLIVETIDAAGNIQSVSSVPTVLVAPPFVSFLEQPVNDAKVAQNIVSDRPVKGSISLVITNNGNVPAKGLTTIDLDASLNADQIGTSVTEAIKNMAIKPGASKVITLPLKSIPALADGDYYFVAQVTDPDGGITFISSPDTKHIAAPYITLAASFAPNSTAVLTTGATLTITNNGNVDDVTPFTAVLAFSTDSAGTQAVAGLTSTVVTGTIHIKAGKSVNIHLNGWKSLASSLTASVPYFATVTLTDASGNSAFAVNSISV
ncbi:MAG TPA: choice-of-anchor tandem repeat GloVer-containing protein [Tepidisphaeraceae bacterium]|nr:choice-of-anchor tandem repeat GloVer-containing protein [Tepidisphaeraceae bacterium]